MSRWEIVQRFQQSPPKEIVDFLPWWILDIIRPRPPRAKVTSNSRVRNELMPPGARLANSQKSFSIDLIAIARALADTAGNLGLLKL
jgi:hypothetical protein